MKGKWHRLQPVGFSLSKPGRALTKPRRLPFAKLRLKSPRYLYSQLVQTFVQLDIRAPGIGDEGEGDAQVRPLGKGHVELQPARFSFLAKSLETYDLEADVIEHAALRRNGGGVGFGKRQVNAGQIRGVKLPSFPRLGAEHLGVPRLHFKNI